MLLYYGIRPKVIFSLDAGFASQEHFCGCTDFIRNSDTALVIDALSSPAVIRLPFRKKYTYASSHPLVQEFRESLRPDLTPVSNPDGNVGGLMLAVCAALFPIARPRLLGNDGGHRSYVTHARGTAYYRRFAARSHRLDSIEAYGYRLSPRYGRAR